MVNKTSCRSEWAPSDSPCVYRKDGGLGLKRSRCGTKQDNAGSGEDNRFIACPGKSRDEKERGMILDPKINTLYKLQSP